MPKKTETKLKRWDVRVYEIATEYRVMVHAPTQEDAEREARGQVSCKMPNVVVDKKDPKNMPSVTRSYEDPEYEKAKLKGLCDRGSLGGCLHTALRKCCDSKPTTAAWCLIDAAECSPVWEIYLDSAWALLSQITNRKDIIECLKAANEGIHCLKEHRGLGNALHSIFELFDDEDWKGFACYLMGKD